MANIPQAPFNLLDGAYDESESNFQISVVIGGVQKQMQAKMDSKPEEIASRFIREQNVDRKYLKTLTNLI